MEGLHLENFRPNIVIGRLDSIPLLPQISDHSNCATNKNDSAHRVCDSTRESLTQTNKLDWKHILIYDRSLGMGGISDPKVKLTVLGACPRCGTVNVNPSTGRR